MQFDSKEFGDFFSELVSKGYHIFKRTRAREGYYPNDFPEYPLVNISTLKPGDRITVRAFFAMDNSQTPRVDSGAMDLEVECIKDERTLLATIETALPPHFVLSKGTSIELDIDEVLLVHR